MTRTFRWLSGALVACGLLVGPATARADDLKVGDQAPGFTLPGTDGKTYDLAKLKGGWVVLAWFPKAFTGG